MSKNNIIEVKEMEIINLGLIGFYDSVKSQQVSCVHVDWRPAAGGKLHLIDILERLKEANLSSEK